MKYPAKFWPTTWEWYIKSGPKEKAASYIPFDFHQETKAYRQPKGLENPISRNFRDEFEKQPTPAFVAVIPSGRVSGKSGWVVAPDGRLIWDVSVVYPTKEKKRTHRRKSLPPIQRTEETVAVIAFRFSNIYYHWLFDVLPRIHLLRKVDKEFSKVIVSYITDKPLPFQSETLSMLRIPKEQIIEGHRGLRLEAQQLVVPSVPGYSCSMPKWTCDFLRDEFLNKTVNKTSGDNERIYISREKARFRRVLNEDKVLEILSNYGFKKVVLEGLPFTEQVQLFSKAQVVVAAHGSGLANLVFCNPGTKVLELFPRNYLHVVYWVLSHHVNLDYYYLIGEGEEKTELQEPFLVGEDITVNISQLTKLLGKMKL